MLGINGKQWNDIQWTDVEEFLNEIEESFFFEFKKDEVSGAKLIKEIAALANTYGGYVFLGVSDDKKIEGCQKWDEQRIHATIHDSLSPIPIIRFICYKGIFKIISDVYKKRRFVEKIGEKDNN